MLLLLLVYIFFNEAIRRKAFQCLRVYMYSWWYILIYIQNALSTRNKKKIRRRKKLNANRKWRCYFIQIRGCHCYHDIVIIIAASQQHRCVRVYINVSNMLANSTFVFLPEFRIECWSLLLLLLSSSSLLVLSQKKHYLSFRAHRCSANSSSSNNFVSHISRCTYTKKSMYRYYLYIYRIKVKKKLQWRESRKMNEIWREKKDAAHIKDIVEAHYELCYFYQFSSRNAHTRTNMYFYIYICIYL